MILALGGSAVCVYATSRGLSLSEDSISYLATSQSLRTGSGLGYWLEPSMTTWPPLEPALLAALGLIGDTLALARWLQVGLHAANALIAGSVARRFTERAGVVAGVVAVMAFSPWTIDTSSHLWTETLFVTAELATFLVLSMLARPTSSSGAGRSRRDVVLVTAGVIACWVGFLTRYLGATLVVVGVLVLVIVVGPAGRRWRLAASWGLGGCFAPLMVAVANRSRSGNSFGPRSSSTIGLQQNLADAWSSVGRLLLTVPSVPAGACAVVGAGCVAAWFAVEARRRPQVPGHEVALAAALVVVVYTAALVGLRSVASFDRLGYRLLFPDYAPVLLLFAWLFERSLASAGRVRPARLFAGVLGGVLVAWTVANGLVMAAHLHTEGADLTAQDRSSTRATFDGGLLDGCLPITNDPFSLHLAGVDAQYSPRRTYRWSNDPTNDLADLDALLAHSRVCLVWVHDGPSAEFLDVTALASRYSIVKSGSTAFADVYRIEPSHG